TAQRSTRRRKKPLATASVTQRGSGELAGCRTVGGPRLPRFLERLNPNGRYVTVGVVGGQPPADFGMRLIDAFRRSLSFATFSSDTVSGPERQAVRSSQFADAARGGLRTVAHEVLPLEQAAAAHRAMDAGEVFGRVVLVP
ncbi:zinc-binding dehydrogenase, partial [Kitasatospora sp. NPDC056783]|uniref:zinc-binding dehydrogenase n=1 Tax=Kitasatospora sp. NPDC056783 TaxID=3345943 RepID=UPI003695C319